MKRLLTVVVGVVVSGALLAQAVEAGQRGRRGRDGRRVESRVEVRRDGYFRDRDVVVIREYYRPYFRDDRGLPRGMRKYYARRGHLPPGWARRIRPVPVYVERHLPVVPRGYRRGIIDGHVVVHNDAGFILDLALLF